MMSDLPSTATPETDADSSNQYLQTEWEDGPRLQAPLFYHGAIFAFAMNRNRSRVYKLTLDANGKPDCDGPKELDVAPPLESDHNYVASCVFQGRLYLFGARDTHKDRRYNILVTSTVNPESSEEKEWAHPQELEDVWGTFPDWYGKIPDHINAEVLGDRMYIFTWRSENWSNETIWFTSSSNGSDWDEPMLLTATEYNPFFAVGSCFRKGQPVLAIVGTRKSEHRSDPRFYISYVTGQKTVIPEDDNFNVKSGEWDNQMSLASGSVLGSPSRNMLQFFCNEKVHGTRNELLRYAYCIDERSGARYRTGIETKGQTNRHNCDAVLAAVPTEDRDFRQCTVLFTNRLGRRPMSTATSYLSDYFTCCHHTPEAIMGEVSAWTLLGVVEGVVPFTRNGHSGTNTTSSVQYGTSARQNVTTTITSEMSVSASLGNLEDVMRLDEHARAGSQESDELDLSKAGSVSIGWSFKAMFAVTNNWSKEVKLENMHEFRNSELNADGNLGFLVFSRPILEACQYRRQSFDRRKDLGVFLVVMTKGAHRVVRSYPLQEPCRETPAFEGLRSMPKSSDLSGWRKEFPPHDETIVEKHKVSLVQVSAGHVANPKLTLTSVKERSTSYQAETTIGGKVAEGLFGIKVGASFSYKQATKVVSSFSQFIQGRLELPGVAVSGPSEAGADGPKPPVTNIEVEPAWYVPHEGASLPQTGLKPPWVPDAYVPRGIVPWFLTWKVIEPKR